MSEHVGVVLFVKIVHLWTEIQLDTAIEFCQIMTIAISILLCWNLFLEKSKAFSKHNLLFTVWKTKTLANATKFCNQHLSIVAKSTTLIPLMLVNLNRSVSQFAVCYLLELIGCSPSVWYYWVFQCLIGGRYLCTKKATPGRSKFTLRSCSFRSTMNHWNKDNLSNYCKSDLKLDTNAYSLYLLLVAFRFLCKKLDPRIITCSKLL